MKRTIFQPCKRLMDGKSASYLSRFLLAITLLVIMTSTVAEANCWEDSLDQVDGDILVMDSEAVYQVIPENEMISVFWLPPARMTICDSIADVGGTLLTYYQILNSDHGVSVWATRER